ncbi:MAG: guanylate kinase [Alphaproteobacteria bacterium]
MSPVDSTAHAHGIHRRGVMLVMSSPSGAGKSTIARSLLARDSELHLSVSVTTRPPRPGEVDGRDYHFITVDEFRRMVDAAEFLEHARVFDNYYGTPRAAVEQTLRDGNDVLFDIDWQGAQQLGANARSDLVSVFILPPSVGELEHRLRSRAQDSEAVMASRMAKAADEMSHWPEYQYVIINRDVEKSIDDVHAILRAERLRRRRQIGMIEFVNQMRGS